MLRRRVVSGHQAPVQEYFDLGPLSNDNDADLPRREPSCRRNCAEGGQYSVSLCEVLWLVSNTHPFLRVWIQVHAACIEDQEFRLAQICGLNIVVHAVSRNLFVLDCNFSLMCRYQSYRKSSASYERRGYFDEDLALMEAGPSLGRARVS